MFRDMLNNEGADNEEEYLAELRKTFRPQAGVEAEYCINIEEKSKSLIIQVKGPMMECKYGEAKHPDVELQLNRATMEDIVNGRMTFQRAFMSGATKMKGDFKLMRALDQLFTFENK